MSGEPTGGLARYQSVKRVLAGEITDVHALGCEVRERDGTAVYRVYPEGMTARYTPVAGDFWICYEAGYEALSPRQVFLDGYMPMDAPAAAKDEAGPGDAG